MIKKGRQHYVWQHYLRAWTTDGQLWCMQDGKCFRKGTKNVAYRQDFYRLKEIRPSDLDVIRQAITSQLDPFVRGVVEGWFALFTKPFAWKKAYEAGDLKSQEYEAMLDVAINDIEENLHAHVEGHAVPVLAALRSRPERLLEDDDLFTWFSLFIAMQYMRTPRMQEKVTASVRGLLDFDVDASWGLMRTILASAMGFQFHRRHSSLKLTVLDAPPEAAFITGDQPILNTHAVGQEPETVAERLQLYYPLSAARAVLIEFQDGQRGVIETTLAAAEVAAYNDMIAAIAVKQLYGSSKEALKAAVARRQGGQPPATY